MTGGSITAATSIAAVIGSPIRHSLSPTIHNAAFASVGLDWAYAAFEVAEADVPEALGAMRTLGLAGLNVTMPCKEAVAGHVDRRSTDAETLAAVNCVRWDGDLLVGENYDGPGFVASLHDEGIDPSGMRCAIVGAGGAARAVGLALMRSGVDRIDVVNRTPASAERAVAAIGTVARVGKEADLIDADLIVDSTPLGMAAGDPLPFGVDDLSSSTVVADLVYHPATTPLLAAAAERGCRTVNGLGMLVHQAALAFEAWTGREAPLEDMQRAVVDALGARDQA